MNVDITMSTSIRMPMIIAGVELVGSFSSWSMRSLGSRFSFRFSFSLLTLSCSYSLTVSVPRPGTYSSLLELNAFDDGEARPSGPRRTTGGGIEHIKHIACHSGSRTDTTLPSSRSFPGNARGSDATKPSL